LTLDRAWLLGTARAEREALGRTIQYTPPRCWEGESPSPGWRNRDIVAHLAATEVAAAAALAGETPGEVEAFVRSLGGRPFSLDEFNEYSVRKRAETPLREVIREWGRAADVFLSGAAAIDPEE